jgi:hypothetical protein
MQGQFDSVYKLLKEREQENKILLSQLNSLRKIVKHKVPPIFLYHYSLKSVYYPLKS